MAKRKKKAASETHSGDLENRSEPRLSMSVPTVVKLNYGEEGEWKEACEITTITRNGAALPLSRECSVGHLVMLAMDMPRDLRVYDLDEELYPMVAVIQNCTLAPQGEDLSYHIGVAFIGREVPETYHANPQQCYRIKGMTGDGLWEVVEGATPFKSRKHSRFWRRIEVVATIRDHTTRTTEQKAAFTRDISMGGMSLWGDLGAEVGERIKVKSVDHNFFAVATVRNITVDEEDASKTLTHIEFDGTEFPVEKIHLPPAEGVVARSEGVVDAVGSDDDPDPTSKEGAIVGY